LKQSVCCFPFVAAVFWDFRGLFEIFSKFPRATAKREWSASRGRKIQKTENTEAKHTKKKNYSRRVSREQSAQIIFNLKMKKWKSIHSYSSLVRACILYFVFCIFISRKISACFSSSSGKQHLLNYWHTGCLYHILLSNE